MTPIRTIILKALASAGGEISGTCNLYKLISASDRNILIELNKLNHFGKIHSTHTHGGRGNLALHKLTRAGWRSVHLTEKGKYVKRVKSQ